MGLESMASGTPVVDINDRRLVEVIDEIRIGCCSEMGNIEELGANIERALDKQLRLSKWFTEQRVEISIELTLAALADHNRSMT